MRRISYLSVIFMTVCLAALGGCRSGSAPSAVEERGFDFGSLKAYSITGGDTEAAQLTGFERDSFHSYFVEAAREALAGRGLNESSAGPDVIVRYTLGERLVVTALDAQSRRLIWRGESAGKFLERKFSREWVHELTRQALAGFPKR
ncbi:MAG TPA: DUF4136 domain-containing protein [candidate division Zixibacteria bacterium]|nr:DUF4136 domain-containing protein [candidate division Zixibacteria bacterium]